MIFIVEIRTEFDVTDYYLLLTTFNKSYTLNFIPHCTHTEGNGTS